MLQCAPLAELQMDTNYQKIYLQVNRNLVVELAL